MDAERFVESARTSGEALAEAAEGNLRRDVPSCPGWTVADLVFHVGSVELFWADVVAQATGQQETGEVHRPTPEELLDWYRDAHRRLVSVLENADPAAECWTWGPPHTVGFACRRMAQEVAVHRWDAEQAVGADVAPIDPELAVDGIDEYLTYFLDRPGDARPEPVRGSLHLHCTDAEGEWLVAPRHGAGDGDDLSGGAAFTVSVGHAKGDAAIRGPASDILLALWRRLSLDALDVVGDRSVAERFVAWSQL